MRSRKRNLLLRQGLCESVSRSQLLSFVKTLVICSFVGAPNVSYSNSSGFLLGSGRALLQQSYGSARERDRMAMYYVRQQLENEFVGSEVFPNDSNQAVNDYINFILSPFEAFYIHNRLPDGMRMLPVAGPSGVAKTLIVRRALSLLIDQSLMREDRRFFQQGDENAEVDLSVVDMYRVPEKDVNDFNRSTDYQKRKEIFLQVNSVIVFDEASHMPSIEAGELQELIDEAVAEYRRQNPVVDEDIRREVTRPEKPERDEFRTPNGTFSESRYNRAMLNYEREYGRYVLQTVLANSPTSNSHFALSLSRNEEIRRVVSRVTTQYFAQQRLRAIEAEIWQALAGGRIEGTQREEAEAELKRQLEDINQRMADLRARHRNMSQADAQSINFIEAQVEEIVGIRTQITREGEAIGNLSGFSSDIRRAGPVLYRLTLQQAQDWATRSGNFTFRWDEEGYNRMSEADKFKAWRALVSDINDNPEQFPEVRATTSMFGSRGEEPVKLYEAFGFEAANLMLGPINNIISNRTSGHRTRISELEARMNLIQEREGSFQAAIASLEEQNRPTLLNIISDYADLHTEFETLIFTAVVTSPAVQKKVQARYDNMTAAYLAENYPDYYRQLVEVDQVDADAFREDMIMADDIKLTFEELVRIDKAEAFRLVEDTIRDGHLDTTIYYSFTSVLFLLNELDIEREVRQKIIEARNSGQPIDYDTYERFYLEALANDAVRREDQVQAGSQGATADMEVDEAFEDNLYDWSARFYKAYFPNLIRDRNVIATRRRLGGQIGPLFITPPNSHQVANLVAQRITTVFDSYYTQVADDLNGLQLGLAIDRNVAMALVPIVQDASLGVAQTLERVAHRFNGILGSLEPRLREISRRSTGSDRLQIMLTLERRRGMDDSYVIAVRIAPPSLSFESNVFSQSLLDADGLVFPENSLIGQINIPIDDSLVFRYRNVQYVTVLDESGELAGDPELVLRRKQRVSPELTMYNPEDYEISSAVGVTAGVEQRMRDQEENAARSAQENRESRRREAIRFINNQWRDFFWPATEPTTLQRFGQWASRGRYTPDLRESDSRFEGFDQNEPAVWFLNWYRDATMRALLTQGVINRDNYVHFLYHQPEGDGFTPLEELDGNVRGAIDSYKQHAIDVANSVGAANDALTAAFDPVARLFADDLWSDADPDSEISTADEIDCTAALKVEESDGE